MKTPLLAVPLLGVLFAATSLTAADNWTAFQNRQQVQIDSNWNWSAAPKTAWKIELTGYGQSSPVVWNDRVFITTVEGPNKENCLTTAYALKDGQQLWQQSLANPTPAESSFYISKAAPTPVVDDNQVVVFFEGGLVASYSHEGNLQWQKDLVAEYGAIDARHGLSSSLEQNEENVFVWVERQTEPYILALNKKSGDVAWKSAGLGVTSWASPRLMKVAGEEQLLLSGIGKIAGFDPATGNQLWEITGISGNSTPTPFPLKDGRFLIGATTGQGDGDEGRAAESNGVIAITKQDDNSWAADFVWRATKATSSFGTPVANDSTTFFVNKTGILFGLDINSGQQKIAERTAGSVWATPLVTENHLLLFGKSGTLEVFKLSDKLELVQTVELITQPEAEPAAEGEAPNRFAGPTLYAAIAVEDKILVRTGNELTCLESAE